MKPDEDKRLSTTMTYGSPSDIAGYYRCVEQRLYTQKLLLYIF